MNTGSEVPTIALLAGQPLSPNMEVVLYNLGRMLADDHCLDLVVGEDEISERLRYHYTVYATSVPRWDAASLRYARSACEAYLDRCRPFVLMNIAQSSLAWAVASVGKQAHIPTVVRVTGDLREAGLGLSAVDRLKSWVLHHKLVVQACQRASLVLTMGETTRRQLIKKGIPPTRIQALPQPFDPEPFQPLSSEEARRRLKRELGLDADRQVVLFVGRLSWLKGADRLIGIINRVQETERPLQFCIVGTGPYESRLRHYSEQLVHLTGPIPPSQIVPYYQAADAMIVPSRTEGLPNVVLEALATGVPIVATPVGEIPQYVTQTAQDSDELSDLILKGEWVRDPLPRYFDWAHQRQAYASLFRRVIDEHNRGRA